MSGGVQIHHRDGHWILAVNSGRERVFDTFDQALVAAGNVTFAPGELPGSWRVHIDWKA